jgi:hypothetical protein
MKIIPDRQYGLVRGMLTLFSRSIHDLILTVKITVKPAHAVTSVKQSPVLKGHIFLVLS